ncbi:MAG: steroid delta-isomerase-like uncharacterized protein [Oleiphilaceae bacterium]|jgi:steroid delta-isomerase-like uncharacterized protein
MDRTDLHRHELDQARRKIILAHIEAEGQKDAQGTVDTFSDHPRYEIIPTGEIVQGGDKVFDFWQEIMAAFPDFTFDIHEMHFAERSVIVESTFRGTHLGTWQSIPPTGKTVAYRMCNVFVFDGTALLCERLNFDLLTVLTQLGLVSDVNAWQGKVSLFVSRPHVFLMGWIRQLMFMLGKHA